MKNFACIFIGAALASAVAASALAQTDKTVRPAEKQPAAKAPAAQPVQVKTDTAFSYVALEMTGSYDQHSTAFTRLYGEAGKQGIVGGMPFGVYWNSPGSTPVEQLKWDVGFTLPAGKTVAEPLKLKKWEFSKMAATVYEGSFGGEGMANVYNELYRWIGENGFKPSGPLMERYLSIPVANDKGEQSGKVEILVPVEKMPEKKTAK